MKMNAITKLGLWMSGLALLVSACMAPPKNTPSSPVENVVLPNKQAGLREVTVNAVTVQIGIGSPMPVEAVIDGTWPGLCAQLADIQQEVSDTKFELRLRATADPANCPPDHLGLPFHIAIPLNLAEKPFGSYTVTANGVTTTFDWNGKPTDTWDGQPIFTDPTPTPATENRFAFEGISFALDPVLAARATGEIAPENPASADTPYWSILPQLVYFSLEGYPQVKSIYTPHITVYPVEDYRRLSENAGKIIDELKNMLAQKPADTRMIPFLPITNTGQVFHSNLQYLDFQNGSGVRYLAIYAQYVAPVNNADLLYTYQGLTADGRYYVSVVLPVNHPSLPKDLNALSQSKMDGIAKDYDKYRAEVTAMLAAQATSSFTPDLAKLDALVASLRIER